MPNNLSSLSTEQLVAELVKRGWTIRVSTTGRYKRAVIEDWYKKEPQK